MSDFIELNGTLYELDFRGSSGGLQQMVASVDGLVCREGKNGTVGNVV